MKLQLDHQSPVPLYHQIRAALSYQIATGRLGPGDLLLPVREAAQAWDVNLHTVRRAYRELVEAGLLESRPGLGTHVLQQATGVDKQAQSLERFLARLLSEAKRDYSLSADDLAALLANWRGPRQHSSGVVYMLECSQTQCQEHVRQLKANFDIDARPWCLAQKAEPPRGTLLATFFHYNEIRRRWPHRLQEVHFTTIRPDAELLRRLPPGGSSTKPTKLILCEFEQATALNIAADVTAILRDEAFCVQPLASTDPAEFLRPRRRTPVLFPPRVWGSLSAEQRAHPLAIEMRYSFPGEQMRDLGRSLGWKRTTGIKALQTQP